MNIAREERDEAKKYVSGRGGDMASPVIDDGLGLEPEWRDAEALVVTDTIANLRISLKSPDVHPLKSSASPFTALEIQGRLCM
jgi:hypothetical protein